ncbi:hypothetical protein HYY75_03170 [bacterium]|nr:hypothetical protein [bacterium]
MLLWQKSETGSIRELNQDVVLFREERGIFIVTDGHGNSGREAAEIAAESLVREVQRLNLYSEVSADRIKQIIESMLFEIRDLRINRPGFQGVKVSAAVACVIGGNLFLAQAGTCGIIAEINGRTIRLEPSGLLQFKMVAAENQSEFSISSDTGAVASRVLGPFPIRVGDWVLAFTEGLLVSQPLDEIEAITAHLREDPEQLAQAIFQRASSRYDGDDRTMVMARFLQSDIKVRSSGDTVLTDDIDLNFRLPIWLPLLMLSGLLGASLLGLYKWFYKKK